MDYRAAFVHRALDIIRPFLKNGGIVRPEVKNLSAELGDSKTPQSLTTEEFNLLQDAAERIDTQQRINQVQKTIRRSSASKVVVEQKSKNKRHKWASKIIE